MKLLPRIVTFFCTIGRSPAVRITLALKLTVSPFCAVASAVRRSASLLIVKVFPQAAAGARKVNTTKPAKTQRPGASGRYPDRLRRLRGMVFALTSSSSGVNRNQDTNRAELWMIRFSGEPATKERKRLRKSCTIVSQPNPPRPRCSPCKGLRSWNALSALAAVELIVRDLS